MIMYGEDCKLGVSIIRIRFVCLVCGTLFFIVSLLLHTKTEHECMARVFSIIALVLLLSAREIV